VKKSPKMKPKLYFAKSKSITTSVQAKGPKFELFMYFS
jgi:hypothetical protein